MSSSGHSHGGQLRGTGHLDDQAFDSVVGAMLRGEDCHVCKVGSVKVNKGVVEETESCRNGPGGKLNRLLAGLARCPPKPQLLALLVLHSLLVIWAFQDVIHDEMITSCMMDI